MAYVGILYNGVPLINAEGSPLVYDDAVHEAPPAECCCGGCTTCPCCIRCPNVSATVDFWVEGQVQVPGASCTCSVLGTPVPAAFDDCALTFQFGGFCEPNTVEFDILQENGECIMRAVLSGDSTGSGGGGPFTVTWEKNLGVGPIECSDLHELDYVSDTGGANLPCDFTGTTLFADILIP